MQTTIQVVCTKGKSLRDIIEHDDDLADDDFRVVTHRRQGRNPGWAVIESTYRGRQGTIRLEWIGSAHILVCRVVSKGSGTPNLVVGDFVDYLLRRHRERLMFITILPDATQSRRRNQRGVQPWPCAQSVSGRCSIAA